MIENRSSFEYLLTNCERHDDWHKNNANQGRVLRPQIAQVCFAVLAKKIFYPACFFAYLSIVSDYTSSILNQNIGNCNLPRNNRQFLSVLTFDFCDVAFLCNSAASFGRVLTVFTYATITLQCLYFRTKKDDDRNVT